VILNIWEWLSVALLTAAATGFSTFFAELAKDFKNYLMARARNSHKKIKKKMKNHAKN
jgi:hypothetical protein